MRPFRLDGEIMRTTTTALALGAALAGAVILAPAAAVAAPAGAPPGGAGHQAHATTAASAASAADQAADESFAALLAQFYDPGKKYFFTYSDHVIHDEHAHGPEAGLYTDYWWEAQLWETVMDRYQRTHDAQSRQLIDDVYDGFTAAYPDFRDNDWNDDIGWWARGSIRAYELTGETRFLDSAKEKFAYIAQYEDTQYGGGLWWKNVDVGDGTKNEKNIATNGTFVQTAVKLYDATGDTAYLDTAKRIFGWLEATFDTRQGHLFDHISGGGELADWPWTYNFGGYASAGLQLKLATGDDHYLQVATRAADWALANLPGDDGVLPDEGRDDTGGFKAVFTRALRDLVDQGGQTQYEQALTMNAAAAAAHRNGAGLGGGDWAVTPADGPVQSLTASASVAVIQQARG
jgi:predicted alpha-1,6-mannanase (GH76 family)